MADSAIRRLEAIFDPRALLTGDLIPERNCRDWSTEPAARPLAVIRPVDAAEAAKAIVLCRELNLPIVPQGGMTGVCGGATPKPGCVAISTERMVGIEALDIDGATMTVKAGTPLETVQRAADEAGLMFPLDLGARGSCTIGGNIATNAGGTRVIRYGMTRDLVLGLEVVLPDGQVMSSLNKLIKNNAGFDLKHLFVGSEGALGIITRAVLRLVPKPRSSAAAVCAVSGFSNVRTLLESARSRLGPQLSAFEVMWADFWRVVTERTSARSPISGGHDHYVLVEMHGADETADAARFQRWLEDMLEQGILEDAAVAQTMAQVEAFWSLRDSGAEFGAAIGPHISYDVGITIDRMEAFVDRCRSDLALQVPGCGTVFYGHIGDGNLHLDVWMPGQAVGKTFKHRVDAVVYGLVRDLKGSISAEHGIGSSKVSWLGHSRTDTEIGLMRLVKRTLDPSGLMNPGKVLSAATG